MTLKNIEAVVMSENEGHATNDDQDHVTEGDQGHETGDIGHAVVEGCFINNN